MPTADCIATAHCIAVIRNRMGTAVMPVGFRLIGMANLAKRGFGEFASHQLHHVARLLLIIESAGQRQRRTYYIVPARSAQGIVNCPFSDADRRVSVTRKAF